MSKVEDRLKEMFPDRSPRDSMRHLLSTQKASYAKVGRVLGVSSERVWRYAQQQGLLDVRKPNPTGGRFGPLLDALARHPGHTPRQRLQNLRARWGSWKAVAAVLGFNKNYVEAYRRLIGLVMNQNRVDKGSWRRRYEEIHGKGSIPELPGRSGRKTERN